MSGKRRGASRAACCPIQCHNSNEKTKDADGHRFQKIEIIYSFVGANEFSPEYSSYSKK